MKIIARGLFTVILIIAFSSLHAQTEFSTIRGKVSAESSANAGQATVTLLNARDSSVVASNTSDNQGLFRFVKLHAGIYLIMASKVGYSKAYSKPYQVAAGADIDAGTINLSLSTTQLNTVNITAKKDYVEVSPGKRVLNIEQNPIAAGNSVYDVLASSPGVKIMDNQIMLRGGQQALIAINGKPVLMSGEELVNLLKGYQSNSISQIELIDNPGAKYDAAGGGGMINIILKKNKDLGSKFAITESASYGDKYKLSTGINWTLKTDKLNLFASYGFQDSNVPHLINTSRKIVVGNQVNNLDLDYNADIKSRSNNFNFNADYQFAPGQTIGFLVNGIYNNSNIGKASVTNIYTNRQKDSSINTRSDIDRDVDNINFNLNYKANFDKAGKSVLSANGYYSDYSRHSNENLTNFFFDAAGKPDNNPILYTDNSPSHITIRSENIDFSQEFSKMINMEAGVKNSQVNSDNKIDFKQQINGSYVPLASLTDHFIYKERINAGYIKLNGNFTNTTLSLSLRAEQTSSSGMSVNPDKEVQTTYFDLFPNVQLSHDIGKNNQLTLFYSRNIDRPNYQDLNPFIGYVDQFYYSTGNPFLKPDYTNTYQLSDLLMSKYKVSLSMIVTDNFFNTIFQQNDITKVYTTVKANLGSRYQYIAEFIIPVDVTKWWHIDADLSAYMEQYHYIQAGAVNRNSTGVSLYVNQNFKITPKLTAQLYNDYESPTYFAISHYSTLHYMNAGLRYSILKNEGSIRLGVSDIFNTNYNYYHTNYINLDLTAKDRLGSRFITATFSYRFGNSSIKTLHGSTGNDEQKRLGSSSNEN